MIKNARTVRLLKEAGGVVSTWIEDDPKLMNKLLDAGINTMTTKRPAVFVDVMKVRKAKKTENQGVFSVNGEVTCGHHLFLFTTEPPSVFHQLYCRGSETPPVKHCRKVDEPNRRRA